MACFLRYRLLMATDQLILTFQRRVADLWRQCADGVTAAVDWAQQYQQLLQEPLLNFEWVAGHGEERENPRVPHSVSSRRGLERGRATCSLSSHGPAATRMNTGLSCCRTCQVSAISTVLRRLFPGKLSLPSLQDRANSTHSNFNRALTL